MHHANIIRFVSLVAQKCHIAAIHDCCFCYFGCIIVNDSRFRQRIEQIIPESSISRMGNYHTFPCAKKNIGRLAKITGGKHIFQVVLRIIHPQKHPGNIFIFIYRGIKDHHRLACEPGLRHCFKPALPLHSPKKKVTVRTVIGFPIRAKVNAVCIDKANSIKSRILLQFL